MNNYYCYHLIALAANLGLVEIPIKYKNVDISKKVKRGKVAFLGLINQVNYFCLTLIKSIKVFFLNFKKHEMCYFYVFRVNLMF